MKTLKRKRGRPKGSKNKSIGYAKETKDGFFVEKLLDKYSNVFLKRTYIRLTCKKCKKEYVICINNPDIYTEEVRKNWTCLLCPKDKKEQNQ